MKRWTAWLGAAATLVALLGIAVYAALGEVVIRSTGTMGPRQRTGFDLLFLGALLGTIGAAALFVLVLGRAPRGGH